MPANPKNVERLTAECLHCLAKKYMLKHPTDASEAEMVTVPNFIGLTVTEANARAAQLGLNIQLTGLVSGSGDAAYSNRQSIKEGERVFRGTVIEVNFYYQDTSEN